MHCMQPPFDPRQGAARLVSESDDVFHLEGVRWGFDERGPYEAWVGRFCDAVVDAKRVVNVSIAIEPFPPEWIAAHSFLVFELAPESPVRNRFGQTDSALVISAEAHLRVGQSFSLVAGMCRTYPMMIQVGTWSDVVQKTCRGEGHKIIRHILALTETQKREMLVAALRRATAAKPQFYNTLTNSCLTTAIREINAALPWRERMWNWIIPGVVPNLAAAIPRTAPIFLTARHALRDTPCILTQPEKGRFPAQQARLTPLASAVRGLSASRFWRPGVRLVGLALGLAVARERRMGRFGTAALGLLGQLAGRVTADVVKSLVNVRFEPSEPYLEPERD
ncbi:MAG: DUF4105 domain-containing protein [Proteobacteria bacterium]|nr:DUF4105 domain-containing protein [Pseudomonadota bacterium]